MKKLKVQVRNFIKYSCERGKGIIFQPEIAVQLSRKMNQNKAKRLKISTYYAYQTKAEESSYLFQKRIKDRLAQLRPKTTSKNVEDECYHLVEEVLTGQNEMICMMFIAYK
ncbi:unnamed protein product [Rhizophagus irregularis]|nr:unnamed protein product [Rhizophagus irregularis]